MLSSGLAFAAPQDEPKVVSPPQVPTEASVDEPLFMRSEAVPHQGQGFVEGWDEVLRREAAADYSEQENPRLRNGRQGSWRVPGIRRSYRSHSGDHYVFNKWGDTRMGIGFNRVVDLKGAWVAGQGAEGGPFAQALMVVAYRDGVEVAKTEWHTEVGSEYAWFGMDLDGIDRIEFVAEPHSNGAGFFAMDDLTFVLPGSGQAMVVDFEDLDYEDVLTGSGYLGLTWEEGSGSFEGEGVDVVSPPGSNGAAAPPPPGVGFDGGTSLASGNGTLPILLNSYVGPINSDPGTGWVPPDTCGSVGIDHFISVVNMHISVYEKDTGTRVLSSSMQSFFNTGGNAGDPRVVFDPDSERWIVNATDFNSRIWLAVSSTSDPTGNWFKTWFNPGQGSDAGDWPDYQTLGVDSRWIMTAAYMVGGNATMSLFCLDKAPLVAANQSLGNIAAFRQLSWEGAIQPCVHWQDAGEAYAISWNNSTRLRLRTISPPVGSPTMSSSFVNLSSSWQSPPSVPQNGGGTLDALDGRLMNSVYNAGSVWTAHSVATNGRASSRYYEVNPNTSTEVQLGTVRDNVNQSLNFFNPSISVNSQGHAVLGCTGSDASIFPGAWYTGRLATDPPGEMAFPVPYFSGQSTYSAQGGSSKRWGDYSLTSTDPVDDTVWTIQEYSRTGGGWGNYIGQFGFDDSGCTTVRFCDPSALGHSIDIDSCDVSGPINLTYSGGTPGLVGYLLVGMGNQVIADPPGAFGDLCLGGAPMGRYIADAQVINGAGQIVTDVINGNVGGGIGSLPGPLGGTIMPGDTWNWQYWARVPIFGSTFSDALMVTFQ